MVGVMQRQVSLYYLVIVAIVALAITMYARANADPLSSPYDLYVGAVARLAAIPQQSYLSYVMDDTQTHRGSTIAAFTRSVVERRTDRGSWNREIAGEAPGMGGVGAVSIGRHYLIPDAFIPYRSESAPQGVLPTFDTPEPSQPNTIATVHSSPSYVVTLVGEEAVGDCGLVAHLKLSPKRDPSRYNVREMWVRRSDMRLCKATFESRTFQKEGGSSYPAIDTVVLDKDGLIASWSSFIQVHYVIGTYGVVDTGTFTNVIWSNDQPQYLFDYAAWKTASEASPPP